MRLQPYPLRSPALKARRCVLFSSSEEPSLRWLQDVWREAAEADADAQEVPRVQFAAVDTAVSPELAERFAVTAPAVLLFRQRQARCRTRKLAFCCCCSGWSIGCSAVPAGLQLQKPSFVRCQCTPPDAGMLCFHSSIRTCISSRACCSQVFRYDNSDLSPEALRRFVRAPGGQGRAVPPPPGALELALQALRGSDAAVRQPLAPVPPPTQPCLLGRVLHSHNMHGLP